jgi:hypothetical protein
MLEKTLREWQVGAEVEKKRSTIKRERERQTDRQTD